ncbi:MAG TPA: c-type cytochrome [Myxococcota bacterium]|jgi:mono/diheme cytochrome c family protein
MNQVFRVWLLALVGAQLVFSVGAAAAEPAFDPVLAQMGAEEFPRYCGSCHGVRGEGDGPTAEVLRTRPADLTRIAARRGGSFPAGEIARFIDGRFALPAHGSREMPVWGDRFGETIPEPSVAEEITRGKIAVLVEYLKSIQRKD